MLKLYNLSAQPRLYWETWEADGVHTVHWGELGSRGESKTLKDSFESQELIEKEIVKRLGEEFCEIPVEELSVLVIEYQIDGDGNEDDLDKRYFVQEIMDEVLGWTGLGHCDGGSIGMGTMEVCCLVVDFQLAKRVISAELKETEEGDFSRIYDETLDSV